MVAFSFLYDVFGIFAEALYAVVISGCCLGGASLLHTSSFITDEISLLNITKIASPNLMPSKNASDSETFYFELLYHLYSFTIVHFIVYFRKNSEKFYFSLIYFILNSFILAISSLILISYCPYYFIFPSSFYNHCP